MSWIGIECDVESHELVKWGNHLITTGGGVTTEGGRVGAFLLRCGELVSGATVSSLGLNDRMREIEVRAVASVEKKRNEIARATGGMVGSLVAQSDGGVTPEMALGKVMNAAGMKGWCDGREQGKKNGGVLKSYKAGVSRKRKYVGGGVVRSDGKGSVVASVEQVAKEQMASDTTPARGGCRAVYNTLAADKSYAHSFDGWAGVQLRRMGFKMSHVARGMGVDVSTAWRCISGYERYWKRQGVGGMVAPEASEEWRVALESLVLIASGRSDNAGGVVGGASVVCNGTRDCGIDKEIEEEGQQNYE